MTFWDDESQEFRESDSGNSSLNDSSDIEDIYENLIEQGFSPEEIEEILEEIEEGESPEEDIAEVLSDFDMESTGDDWEDQPVDSEPEDQYAADISQVLGESIHHFDFREDAIAYASGAPDGVLYYVEAEDGYDIYYGEGYLEDAA